MHFGESLHIFIKYVTTCDTNTITFKNNILSFNKEELVKIWNNVLNNNLQWPSIARCFVNYEIKSITPKDMENNIKQYKFPSHFTKDTILIRPPRCKKITKKSILCNVQGKKLFCIKKRVHFNDNVIEKICTNTEDKHLLNTYEEIRKELYNTYNNKYHDIRQDDQEIKQSSFSKIPF